MTGLDTLGDNPKKVTSPVADNNQLLQTLVSLMIAEREEALKLREEKRITDAQKEARRIENAKTLNARKDRSQSLCSHKKGQRGVKGQRIDYALGHHTFIDGTTAIFCLICGAKWKPGDTREYLRRGGKKVPNVTSWGWTEAKEKMGESSNTATSSEIPAIRQVVSEEKSDEQFD